MAEWSGRPSDRTDLDGGAEGRERVGRPDLLGEDEAERVVQRHAARRGAGRRRGGQHRRQRLLHLQHFFFEPSISLFGSSSSGSGGGEGYLYRLTRLNHWASLASPRPAQAAALLKDSTNGGVATCDVTTARGR